MKKSYRDSPRVSVITPAFNSEKFISTTIESVISQTFFDWEMIISDDASRDKTVEIVKEYAKNDTRIHIVSSKTNNGPGPCRNKALSKARGRYIAFLDSDDIWYPQKLCNQIKFMSETKISFSFTSYEIIDELGNRFNKVVEAPQRVGYSDLLKNTVIGCLTVMVDRKQFSNLNMPNISSRQPLVVWLRILKTGCSAFGLDEILAKYRIVKGSVSRNKFYAAKNVWKVYRKYEHLNFLESCYYFCYYTFNGYIRNRKRLIDNY